MNPEKIIDENLDSLIKLSKKRNHNILFCCRTHRNYDDVRNIGEFINFQFIILKRNVVFSSSGFRAKLINKFFDFKILLK